MGGWFGGGAVEMVFVCFTNSGSGCVSEYVYCVALRTFINI